MPTMVATVVSPSVLRKVWKDEIRPRLRSARLRDLYLPQDPLQFAAYEWGLSQLIERLSSDVLTGAYTPDPAHIVRGAKSRGLSRPLAFLTPRDALLYRCIISLAEDSLNSMMSVRVGATMKDRARQRQEADRAGLEYGDWFSVWLSKQGIIKELIDRFDYVVESDIANYFASIDLRIVTEHLHSRTDLDRDVVRLCGFLLDQVMRHPTYADAPSLGLPQEPFDASRTIGHTLLYDVDLALDEHGFEYSRFMDDIVIGADDVADGERKTSILQLSLELLGLHPNTAKTRIVPAQVYIAEIMADVNGQLDAIEAELEEHEVGPLRQLVGLRPTLMAELLAGMAAHRAIPPSERPQRWLQVLQRYYTLLRRVGDPSMLDTAIEDMVSHPTAARTILEYCRAFPLTVAFVDRVFELVAALAPIYEDVPLIALESMGNAPCSEDQELYEGTAAAALTFCKQVQHASVSQAAKDRLMAASIPLIGKFGNLAQRTAFCDEIVPDFHEKSIARIQSLPILMSENRLSAASVNSSVPGLSWADVICIEFLRAVEARETKATGIAIGVAEPQLRLQPTRWHIHARALMLLAVAKAASPDKVIRSVPGFLKRLRVNPDRLRDHRAEMFLNHMLG